MGPVAGAADEDASIGPITEGARPVAAAAGRNASVVGSVAGAAGPVAGAAGRGASVGPIAEDAEPVAGVADVGASVVGPVAKAASTDSAAKLSQTGQTFPLQGCVFGSTTARMSA